MIDKFKILGLVAVSIAMVACGASVMSTQGTQETPGLAGKKYKVIHTDAEWKKLLPELSYQVLRHAATEQAFTGKYFDNHEKGIYVCAGCGQELFSSDTKFESGTGWPSFYQPIDKKAVDNRHDLSDGMDRTEVLCSRCGGHLGHVFDDGPKPTGLRYCMNSAAMVFKKAKG